MLATKCWSVTPPNDEGRSLLCFELRHCFNGILCPLPDLLPQSSSRRHFHCIRPQLEKLLDPKGREWCLRQACKSNFGLVWPWPFDLLTPEVDRFMPVPQTRHQWLDDNPRYIYIYTERRMPRNRRKTAKQADIVFMTWDLIDVTCDHHLDDRLSWYHISDDGVGSIHHRRQCESQGHGPQRLAWLGQSRLEEVVVATDANGNQ